MENKSLLDTLKTDKNISLLVQSLKVSQIERVFKKRSDGMLQRWQIIIPIMAIPKDLTNNLKQFLVESGLSVNDSDGSTLVASENFSRTISFGVKNHDQEKLQRLLDKMKSDFSTDVSLVKTPVIDASR